jgi:hypothetical protein
MVNNTEVSMPVTKEFVEQFGALVTEEPVRTKTSIEMVKIVIEGQRVNTNNMFTDEQVRKLFFPGDNVRPRVYSFVRDNQDLFAKPEPTKVKEDCPITAIEQWGRELAAAHGLSVEEITYDSEMMFFVINDQPKLNVVIPKMREAAVNSGFIKAPYAIGNFELDLDMDVEPGQVCYTMCFYMPEKA